MTGRYPIHAGIPGNGSVLTNKQVTIPAALRPSGYSTALIGKWHLGVPDDGTPTTRGFDRFYGFHAGCVDFYSHRYYWGEPRRVNFHDLYRDKTEIFEDGEYLTERITEEATSFIRGSEQKPFFMYIAYNAPHYPMHAPKRYMDRFKNLPFERQVYAAMVAAVDDGVGAIRAELKRLNLLDNTCIFLLGDNGATTEPRAGLDSKSATAGSNGPYRGFKFSLFDGGMHVPGMVSWPAKIPAGQTLNEIAMSMDVMPTILAASGAKLPANHKIDGSNILPVLTSKAKSPHESIYWAQNNQLAVRRGKWKLVINGFTAENWPEGRKPLEGDDAMFLSDLEADPGESKNLRKANPQLVDELATAVHKWHEEMESLAKANQTE